MEHEQRRRPRSTWLIAGSVVMLTVLALGALAVFLYGPRWGSGTVAMPADDASPTEVLKTYLRALDVGDCDTADALTSPETLEHEGRRWCDDIASLRMIRIGEPETEAYTPTGSSPTVRIAATIDVDWRAGRNDGGFSGSEFVWWYSLNQDDAGRSRITGQGAP